MKQRTVNLVVILSSLIALALVFGSVVQPGGTSAQIASITTLADIAGTGTATPIAASGTARWVQITTGCTSALTGCYVNTNAVRWGDSGITTTRGNSIAPGGGQYLQPLPPSGDQAPQQYFYNLASIYYLVQSGDFVTISWGN